MGYRPCGELFDRYDRDDQIEFKERKDELTRACKLFKEFIWSAPDGDTYNVLQAQGVSEKSGALFSYI
jgi:hypothetical protein